jgi:ABC-type uncharacterized transport system substrate-binding protein
MKSSRRYLWFLVTLTVLAVFPPEGPFALAAEKSTPVVLLSSGEAVYKEAADAFIEQIDRPVKVYSLEGIPNSSAAVAVMNDLAAAPPPSLIFAVGAQAAVLGKKWTEKRSEIPVFFALVLNWAQYDLLDQENMAGIAFELSPADYLKNITVFSPDTKIIGVIYSKVHSKQTIEAARKEAEALDLQLVTAAISQPGEFRYHFKKMTPLIDGFWIPADPVVFTLDNFFWLQDQCNKKKIICLGPSENSAKKGLPIAMSASPADIGSLAAKVARLIIDKHLPPKLVGIIPPLPAKLNCNLKTLQKLQPSMNHQVLEEYNSLPGVWQATVVTR